jgi:hypothetical protein
MFPCGDLGVIQRKTVRGHLDEPGDAAGDVDLECAIKDLKRGRVDGRIGLADKLHGNGKRRLDLEARRRSRQLSTRRRHLARRPVTQLPPTKSLQHPNRHLWRPGIVLDAEACQLRR